MYCDKCKQVRVDQIQRERDDILNKKFAMFTNRHTLIAGLLEESALTANGESAKDQRLLLELMAIITGYSELVDRYATPKASKVTP